MDQSLKASEFRVRIGNLGLADANYYIERMDKQQGNSTGDYIQGVRTQSLSGV